MKKPQQSGDCRGQFIREAFLFAQSTTSVRDVRTVDRTQWGKFSKAVIPA